MLCVCDINSDLHELTDSEQVGQCDVITTQEVLLLQELRLQFVKCLVQFPQSTLQFNIVHRLSCHPWY